LVQHTEPPESPVVLNRLLCKLGLWGLCSDTLLYKIVCGINPAAK